MTSRNWAIGVLTILGLAALAAPWLAPYAPDAVDLAARREPPGIAHPFGTDALGRDVLSRVLFGARVSLATGLFSAAIAVMLGTGIGAIAGFVRGPVDATLMRVTDALLAVPRLPLLMIVAAIVTPGVAGLIVMVALVGWMETARVVRAEVLGLSGRPFVEAARASGVPRRSILVRHLMPNVAATIGVAATLSVGRGILLESALSFFGVGVQPPRASWGSMLYQAQATMTSEPWLALFPGVAVFITVLAVNVAGDHAVR
ncbi:MAG: ABC transporter permease [Gemmatimonadota bacterium]